MAQWLRIDQEMTARTYDATVKTFSEDSALPEAGLQNLIDDAMPLAKSNREVSLTDVADLSILREAQGKANNSWSELPRAPAHANAMFACPL